MFAFQDTRGTAEVAFTDRHGGVSDGPYASLNLGSSGDDDPAALAENLSRVTHAFTTGTTHRPDVAGSAATHNVVRMHQVHGADVAVVDETTTDVPVADGLVTQTPGVVLMVRVADCVPVLLADPDRGVVGAVHAGRPGMVAGVVPATVTRMRELGAKQITAWVGPHVCGRCYEVPETMRAEVAAVVPESFAETSWGTPAVDVGAGVRAQLADQGAEIVDASRCTREDENLFSYRRQGKRSGRLAGLVWGRP